MLVSRVPEPPPPDETPVEVVFQQREQTPPPAEVPTALLPPPPEKVADTPAALPVPEPVMTPEPPPQLPTLPKPKPKRLPNPPREKVPLTTPPVTKTPTAPPTVAPLPTMSSLVATVPIADSSWQTDVFRWISSRKTYPDEALRRGEEGRVAIRFTVDRSGRVLEAAIVGSSGSALLDRAALALLRQASLPPFPAAMAQAPITITTALRYSLR